MPAVTRSRSKPAAAQAPMQEHSRIGRAVEVLNGFASTWWYPWMVGAISGANNFTIVLSVPLVGLFIAGAVAGPPRTRIVHAAVANATGTAMGAAVLVLLIQHNGTDWLTHAFPSIFGSSSWDRTSGLMRQYGYLGCVVCSSMPVVLHPLILFALLAQMNPVVLVLSILAGRIVKYCLMGYFAVFAPSALRFFGSAALKAGQRHQKKN